MPKLRPNQFYLPCGALITELPILFQTDMVIANLEDRKTKTRRTRGLDSINVDPDFWNRKGEPKRNTVRLWDSSKEINPNPLEIYFGFKDPLGEVTYIKSPFGKPGDLLWVKETFLLIYGGSWCYKAGLNPDSEDLRKDYLKSGAKWAKWNPSIHMPKDAARIWLMVEDIRVERVQDISEEEAIAEGIEMRPVIDPEFDEPVRGWRDYLSNDWFTTGDGLRSPEERSFRSLWISINGEESWNTNPFVWVIKYRILSKTGRPSLEVIEKNYLEVKGKEVSHE